MTWIKTNKLLSLIILVCAGYLAYYLVNAANWIPYPNSVDYGEGFVMNYAKLWVNGTWDWNINTPPYLTMVYGLGFPILATPFVNLFGYGLWVGRSISFISAIITCVLIYLIVYRMTGKKVYALISSLLPMTQPIFRDWSVMARVDMPAVMFDVLGLYLVLRFKNSKWVYLAVIAFLCAIMVKLTAVAGLGAVCVYYLIYNRKQLLKFAGVYALGLIAILIPLMIISDGTYLNHIIVYQRSIINFHLGTFLFLFNMMIYAFLVLMIPSFMYLKKCWNKKEITIVGIFFVLAMVIDMASSLKPGAASMYYLELIVAGSICASLVLPYIVVYCKRHTLQTTNAIVVTVLIAVFGWYSVKPNIELPEEYYTESVNEVEEILSDSDKPLITENPAIAFNMGKDLYIEYFIFSNMARLGYWDETEYVNNYKKQYFDYVVLSVDMEERVQGLENGVIDGDFTDDALLAIHDNYSLVYETVNRQYPYSLYVYEANDKLKNDDRFKRGNDALD